MSTVVKTRIIKIGNSQGIRIPKILLDQTSLGKEVELELQQGQIIVRSAYRARHNWEDQFKAMAERGDDRLLDGDVPIPTVWPSVLSCQSRSPSITSSASAINSAFNWSRVRFIFALQISSWAYYAIIRPKTEMHPTWNLRLHHVR
jgi:antitoxin MazE